MALPKILLGDGKIVLLSGFQQANRPSAVSTAIVDSEETLDETEGTLDAIAFACVAAGEWWPE